MGVPGEVQNLVLFNVLRGQQREQVLTNPWHLGQYRVRLLLGRPGFPLVPEYQHSFIGEAFGSSHLLVLPPRAERTADGPDHMLWVSVHVDKTGKRSDLTFRGDANDSGFLGKFSTELQAENANQAQSIAYAALAPLLSGLSAYADVPLHIESIETTELATGNTALRIAGPFMQTNFNLVP